MTPRSPWKVSRVPLGVAARQGATHALCYRLLQSGPGALQGALAGGVLEQVEDGDHVVDCGVLVERGVEAHAGAGHGDHDAVGVPLNFRDFAEYESHRRIPHVGGPWKLHVTVRMSVVPSGPTS